MSGGWSRRGRVAGIAVSLGQASRVRQYARAAGLVGQDGCDRCAAALRLWGGAAAGGGEGAGGGAQEELRELESQRRHLSRVLVMEQNRRAQLTQGKVRRLSQRLIGQLQKQITQLDELLEQLIAQAPDLEAKAQKLRAVSGVGPRTVALLLAQMPELGQLNRREAAALAGLAPFNRDSGSLCGKRAIFGGGRAVRTGLYMAALVAARHNPILRTFYQRLRAAGKPPKLALTATMRKLLLALNSALKPDPIIA
jgi:transposase